MRLCKTEIAENDELTFDETSFADIDMVNAYKDDELIESYSLSNDENVPLIPIDTLVAALTLTGEGSEEWILARIKTFDGEMYVVEDAEVEEEPSIEIVQKE